MGGSHSPKDPPDKDQQAPPLPPLPAVADVRLADAPILLLVYFHKALRAELAELRRRAVAAAESGSLAPDFAVELSRRFEFIKLVYKYHSAAEDEVIFAALDRHVKNVACTYSLEHESIDLLFNSVFCCLNVLMRENENLSKALQDLVFSIGTIYSSICKHMQKEEEQVLPLLMHQFSSEEQGSLVWQYIGSVPIMLLEDFLPWLISFISPSEQEDIKHFIKQVLPNDKSLQEVLVSWLDEKNQSTFWIYHEREAEIQSLDESMNMKDTLKFCFSKRLSKEHWHLKKANCIETNFGHNPVNGLLLWHAAIRKDLKEILVELYQMKTSTCFSDLHSIAVQLKFLESVIIFYSDALEKFVFPVLIRLSNGHFSPSTKHVHVASHMESLQSLLQNHCQNVMTMCKFLDKLCKELESFAMVVNKQFVLLETEVFPTIRKNCCHEMQLQLLYMSLHVLPLGLLKCVITWFSAHLSEDDYRSILYIISQRDYLVNKSFAALLFEWFHIGYSGKTSIESFGRDLQKMFSSRFSFLQEPVEEGAGSSSFLSDMQPCKGYMPRLVGPISAERYSLYAGSNSSEKYEISYSSGINLPIFFLEKIKMLHSFPELPGEKGSVSSVDKPVPIDLIFFFHKALKKDLEYLVLGSAQLTENAGLLMEFHQRFQLIRFFYQIHSDAEDEIAFPALEAKGKLQNISHSFTIDHKLEIEYFNKISLILNEMCELNVSITSSDSNSLDRLMKHRQLCMNLQDMCKSMQKLLSDHVHHEEIELWPLFRECFSFEEQEKIIGRMLGRTRAEILQDMIPWLMASLTPDEQHAMMSLWRKATKNTKFDEWLEEWWEGYNIDKVVKQSNMPPSWNKSPLKIIQTYLPKILDEQGGNSCNSFLRGDSVGGEVEMLGKCNANHKVKIFNEDEKCNDCSECTRLACKNEVKMCKEAAELTDTIDKQGQKSHGTQNSGQCKQLQTISQEDLEAAVRRVSCDPSLDPEEKSYVMQNLLMSRWIIKQHISNSEVTSSNGEEIPGQHPSYQDPLKKTFGCKHYKRNCKLVAACCNQLYTCIRCHDEVADHPLNRRSITKMMCMKCLIIQPIGRACSIASCNDLSMGRYYCRICKLFDDERKIYHCPYCNLCRVGEGLGIDYFHCMNCNACMSRSLSVHICREKCFEDNCPICHEDIFTSSSPVKALPCGHLMHSMCFQDYTCTHYTCPICSKSLGDMQVYFRMLDALLAEEKVPDEYHGQTQLILCNDCEKKGTAPFHWLYHKCSNCGSYNTRLL